jgi:type II secretory ATPase GspE/PulE/Tfp pilus assembly ATPase PilB-like protein
MMGIYELLAITDNIKHMIVNRKSILAMRKAALFLITSMKWVYIDDSFRA